MKNRILKLALAKATHASGKQWHGYYTSVEIMALVGAGAKADPRDIERAKENVAKGISQPIWFYFEPPKGFFKDNPDNLY